MLGVVGVLAADLVVADAGAALDRVIGLGVDVVPEADDEVVVAVGHDVERVVVAVRVVLAGEERELHRRLGVGRQRGPEAADGAVGALGGEAVVVLLVGLEPGHARLDRVVGGGAGLDVLARDDVAEGLVGRDLQLDRAGPAATGGVKARPQADALGRRVPGDDAVREAAALERAGLRRGQRRRERRRDQDDGGGATGARDELTAGRLHGANLPPPGVTRVKFGLRTVRPGASPWSATRPGSRRGCAARPARSGES